MYRGKYETTAAGDMHPERKLVSQLTAEAAADDVIPAKEKTADPVKEKHTAPAKKKKKTSAGTVIFYTLYFIMIVAAAVGIWYGLGWLEGWLMDYEASQPDAKCQEVFDRYFADPDWSTVYTLLDPEAVGTITQEEFTTYMENTVGDGELTYTKTSAGLSGGRKYILRLDGKNLGTFSLSNPVTGELEIPDWQLDTVEIFVSAKEEVTVFTDYGNTVLVNGQPLDDSNIIKITSTTAEEYLPEGVLGPRTVTYHIDGLLNAPEVTVTDAQGNTVEMTYDAENCLYSQLENTQAEEISQAAHNFVVEATKIYCRYMVDAASAGQLREYFDGASETYKTIIKSDDRWLQDYKTYDFSDATVTHYCQYSDELFSVRIAMDLLVTRTNNTVKTFSLDTAFFVERYGKSWRVVEMTNVDVNQVLTQVRMTYFHNGKLLSTEMVSTDVTTLQTPDMVAPEGKVLAGWFIQSEDENGDTTYSLMFQPDENGAVKLPAGYTLEPMELHALFEEAK